MSTAVLGVTGTASAATTSWTFTTASAGAEKTGMTSIEIETDASGECSITWVIDGAAGGAGNDGSGTAAAGAKGGRYMVTTDAYDSDVFDLYPGTAGTDAPLGGGTPGLGGTNGSTYGGDGMDGTYDGSTYGGGGGAASIVERNGDQWVGAFGGDGGLSRNQVGQDGGVGGLDGELLDHSGSTDGVDGTRISTGGGVIGGTVTCVTGDEVAPGAPTLVDYVTVGDGQATFEFHPGSYGRDTSGVEVESTFQYQLDGGAWTGFTRGYTGQGASTGELTGLTNMKKHSLTVRATSSAGTSAASAPVTFTPFAPVAAPTGVTATVGVNSVTASWTAPQNSAGIADYMAYATPEGAQSSQDTVFCETAGTSCTLAVASGTAYYVGVVSRDSLGNGGGPTFLEGATAVVPASAIPSTLPRSDGPLTSSETDGKAVAGAEITISGAGFAPGSTVELVVYSTPVKLGEAVVLADGTFSATVTLPENLANGDHHLVATGVDADGDVRNLVVEVSVSGGITTLADTGFSAAPVLGAGALALLAGGGLMVAARRGPGGGAGTADPAHLVSGQAGRHRPDG